MKTRFYLWLIALLLGTNAFAQTGFDGTSLASFLGKSSVSEELKELKANYHCEMANEGRYLSKAGIELVLKDGALTEINLYNNSAVYGNFTGKLPNGLKFGMSVGDVKQLLGKPTLSYSNGYSEFAFSNYILSCWFEGGVLHQVGLALK